MTTYTFRVAMAFWTSHRVKIATKLADMQESGWDVQVVLRRGVDSDITDALGKVPYRWLPHDTATGTKGSLHSKFLTLDGPYPYGTGSKHVWTGSEDYTYPALYENWENMARVSVDAIYDDFLSHWETLWAAAAPPS